MNILSHYKSMNNMISHFVRSLLTLLAFCCLIPAQAQKVKGEAVSFPSDRHAMVRVEAGHHYLLIPIEERAPMSRLRVITAGKSLENDNIRLAQSKVDYFVPLDLTRFGDKQLLLDIHTNGDVKKLGALKTYNCWPTLTYSETFDTTNRESLRPELHHTPAYGWMNDPNGLFYKDGVWHLYYQHNPYGSQWENMTWGHSTSTDLMHWRHCEEAIRPDDLGTVFSGSCVVDKNNTAGFGKNAIIAIFTSAGENQTQSIAYSTDNGMTFQRYEGNPVITGTVNDFRDPHVFWNDDIHAWNLILAAGNEVKIYSSPNLKQWTLESSFGKEYGAHRGWWECPDLFRLPSPDGKGTKWVLVCNTSPGAPAGGSGTQYFIGQFDGHRFTCESKPETEKWMDYGRDHYATVTYDNAPNGRRVAMVWMADGCYAGDQPTKQYRSCDALPRDLSLYDYKGETYLCVKPSPEVLAARSEQMKQPDACCEIEANLKGSAMLTLANDKDEQVTISYDQSKATLTVDRTRCGNTKGNRAFAVKTVAPVKGKLRGLRIFVDHGCLEVFDVDGRVNLTNLIFPTKPYDKLMVSGKAKAKIYKMR